MKSVSPEPCDHAALPHALGQMLQRIPSLCDQLTGVITRGEHGAVLDCEGLALAAQSPALQPSERALCEVVGQLLGGSTLPSRSIGAAWHELPPAWQVLVAEALTISAHDRLVEHTATLQAQGMAVPMPLPATGDAIRIKLGHAQPAPADDPLGRTELGFRLGLSPQQLWDRGRGLCKFKADKAMAAGLCLLAHDGVTVMVGAVTGLQRFGTRLALTGYPLPHHPLINRPDPLHNNSRNPVTYGTVNTSDPQYPL